MPKQLSFEWDENPKQPATHTPVTPSTSIIYQHEGGFPENNGEFCYVERKFSESGTFSFSGNETIKSIDDVAYIFRELENSSIENAFAVLVNKGYPTVIHLGMGTACATQVNIAAIKAAYDAIGAEQLYFVHNHPSGEVKCSIQDQHTLHTIYNMFPENVVQEGIIINTISGYYGTFNILGDTNQYERPAAGNEIPLTLHSFDRLVFSPDYNFKNLSVIRNSMDVAALVSAQRLGSTKKISYLILDRANKVIGNIHTIFQQIKDHETALAEEITSKVILFGGNQAILYGDFDFLGITKLKNEVIRISGNSVGLTDVISINGLHTQSAIDEMVMETSANYNKNDDIRFRFIGEKGAANLDRAEEATTRLDNLNVARKMGNAGKDAKAIKYATGWERGADGKWRYETMDGTLKKGWKEKAERVTGARLSDVINSKELFDAYPQLADVTVSLEILDDSYGKYDNRTKTISINKIVAGFKSVLAHEIQHAIQYIEGFARGGNPSRIDGSTELEREYSTFDELVWKNFGNNNLSTLVEIVQNKEKAYQDFRNSFGKSWDSFFEKLSGLYNTVGDTYFKENYDFYVEEGKKGTSFERYQRLGGEVEARNVQSRLNMTDEERRNSLASETEDVAHKDQIFLNDALEVSASMDTLVEKVNHRFNEELEQQINGELPKGHVYRLGKPSSVLQSAGMPDLPIEMASSRLSDKSMQENHPFDLKEVKNLPEAIQNPMAVFRSATHIGSFVVMTEIEHNGKNFIVAIETNRKKGKIEVNSIRSVHYRTSNSHIANWIDEGLLEYADKKRMSEWLSKQRYNSADVKQLYGRVTNIVKNFENPTLLDGEISSTIDGLSDELDVPVNRVQSRTDLLEGIQRQMKNGRYPGLFDPTTGKIYMVMAEITDASDAQATMLHEIVGHKGIRGLFGDKIGEFTERVLSSLPVAERNEWVIRYNGNKQLAAEEYVARFAEGYENPSMWEKIKAIFRDLLRDLGIDLKIKDNDLKYILWKAKKTLRRENTIQKNKPILFRKNKNIENSSRHISNIKQKNIDFQNSI